MDIKNTRRHFKNGFTIVELIIVIVVVVILASITIVSYTTVQNQARAESAKTNAASVKQAAEAYYNANNAYPTQVAHFSSTFVAFPTDITVLTNGTLSRTNGEKSVMYRYNLNFSATGACIMYWDYAPLSGSPGIVTLATLGSATNSTCNATTGVFPI